MGKSAEVFDIDDTLVYRHPLIRIYSALRTRSPLHKLPPDIQIEDIPQVSHQRAEKLVTGRWERIMLSAHTGRVAIPAMRALLIQSAKDGADIFLLTGRSSDSNWYDGTERQLIREGILPYVATDRRLHTPGGRRTALSKVHGLYLIAQNYEEIRMTDDDWHTVEFGARMLPGVNFRYVYHGFPSYYPSTRELAAMSNISILNLTKIS